jgi:predicted dehydrogenase
MLMPLKPEIMKKFLLPVLTIVLLMSCAENKEETKNSKPVRLITLDPGHFHAALVQKTMYKDVDSVVHVYAPSGNDLQLHLDRVNGYNNRKDDPTSWKEEVYSGNDYFEKMIAEKKGNVVVLAGNNQKKTDYISRSLEAGLNVLADKPMVINSEGFETLKKAFETAKQKDLVLYDIMTERFEITSILQRELAMIPEIFGTLDTGTADHPAVEMISDHNFYKNISGNVVVRPAWFMDESQQGEGIVDVTTHLVDLVQWECFPEQTLDYAKDITVSAAKRWPTNMTIPQFKTITKLDSIPSYLDKNRKGDSILQVWSNGEINYTIKGVHAKVTVMWKYQTESGNDTHYSILRGTNADLVIKQGADEQYKTVLYILPKSPADFTPTRMNGLLKTLESKYPGISLKEVDEGWEVIIPDKYKEGHESHFARVMENYLQYLKNHNMPAWEVPNMLAKYYTTTKAMKLSQKNQ